MHNEIQISVADQTHFAANKIASSKTLSKTTREKCYSWSLGGKKDGVEEEFTRKLSKWRKKKNTELKRH